MDGLRSRIESGMPLRGSFRVSGKGKDGFRFPVSGKMRDGLGSRVDRHRAGGACDGCGLTVVEFGQSIFLDAWKRFLAIFADGDLMKPDQINDEIGKLELSEKLLLVEDIWDAIAASNSEIPMPEWQKRELNKRYGDYKEGKLELHDWKSVHEGLRE